MAVILETKLDPVTISLVSENDAHLKLVEIYLWRLFLRRKLLPHRRPKLGRVNADGGIDRGSQSPNVRVLLVNPLLDRRAVAKPHRARPLGLKRDVIRWN